ncbi:MAG: 2Fe-2S iron-sulfur cluster-binding protein [Elusimicrobiota bacterium]|nr:2Fe-2S iron-sulfur cluster-binding protein [Elusimicrobiota bacterium]
MAERGVDFGPKARKPALRLPEGKLLCDLLTVENSPVYFGCRNGVCGTCLARVTVRSGDLAPPDADEAGVLELLCPDEPKARLACRVRLTADLTVEPLKLGGAP